ncbi:ABC transporter permease [Helcococcus kunzii]|uniref:ABC transporter permease n=1 Tax=Helcococcus kunzii TaxID=40091 RepID=UPI001BAF6C5C|nr:ABC transporter permease [Helcococcus kunzii]QUY65603.1 ABC transporter permease [Helcococcus kunzii]
MLKYILKRITISIFTLLAVLLILFFMLDKMPGSPFNDEKLGPEKIQAINEKYGLNDPVPTRFVRYVGLMLKGDFGESYVIQKNAKITDMLKGRVAISFELGISAVILGTLVGAFLGILSAIKHNTWVDTFASVVSVAGVSVPSYVFALFLVMLFAVQMRLVPVLYEMNNRFLSSILPVISLSMFTTATVSRFLRSEMLEIFNSDYIELARSKGMSENKVILRHGIRNALIPVITVLGPLLVNLMTGSLVIEKIFGIPGIGELFVTGIVVNDYNVVIAIAFLYSVLFIISVLIIDLLYGLIDPRIRLGKGGE